MPHVLHAYMCTLLKDPTVIEHCPGKILQKFLQTGWVALLQLVFLRVLVPSVGHSILFQFHRFVIPSSFISFSFCLASSVSHSIFFHQFLILSCFINLSFHLVSCLLILSVPLVRLLIPSGSGCTTSQPMYCQGGRKSARLEQLSLDTLTSQIG